MENRRLNFFIENYVLTVHLQKFPLPLLYGKWIWKIQRARNITHKFNIFISSYDGSYVRTCVTVAMAYDSQYHSLAGYTVGIYHAIISRKMHQHET